MRFNPTAFNRLLANMGQQILWRPAYACSCVNPDSGAPDPKCKLCKKKGRIWGDQSQTVCGLTKQDTQAEWAASGMWEAGDLVVTIPENSPMWESGQFDRITLLNATDRFSQPLTRGAPTDNLSLFAVKSIDRVFWKNAQTQALVEGGIPKVDADGNLTWTDREPPIGVTYSITGWKHGEYFVWGDFPSSRNMHSGMRLPKRIVLRRWELLGRG
ncbi:hypothetical protein [Pseudomonas sp.]|jgi:hypothetical protein|uniref:hypothetical protein n=1 Tax=Pseudomonas sp. TaxID=306 RepID=UPI003FD8C2C0